MQTFHGGMDLHAKDQASRWAGNNHKVRCDPGAGTRSCTPRNKTSFHPISQGGRYRVRRNDHRWSFYQWSLPYCRARYLPFQWPNMTVINRLP